ncbi:MAG: pilus assembly protein FimV [Gammaproteobacteria bacterium]|jgi:pilus assembly protein FimV
MMKASIRIAVTLSALLITQQVLALGLGKARIESDMSAPLRLSIPIAGFSASGIEIEELQVNVPRSLDQATLGVPDLVMPEGVKTVVSPDGRGGAVVRMSTRTAVREPVLRFALRASWPGGEVVKTYELIIDPPYVAYPRTSASTTITVRAPTSATRAITAPVSARAGTSFGPVAGGATLYPIARSAYPQMSARLPQVMAVIVESNPDAFVGGSADQLLRGAVLALPAASDMRQALAGTSQTATRDAASNTAHAVAEGDTLYAIARRELGIAEGQLPATVARIHALNPQAFANGDINRLQVGAVLQLATQAPTQRPSQASVTASVSEVSELTAQLAQAETNMAAQRQVQNVLNTRLAELTESLRALRERDAQIAEQSGALARELQSNRVASTAPAPVATTLREPVTTVAAPQPVAPAAVVAATTPAVTPARAAPSAPVAEEAGMMSFVESLLSGSAMWAGVGALVMALLAAAFALIRRRQVAAVATQPRTGGADEGAARNKLAEVRERFSKSGRFIAEPLQTPGEDPGKDSAAEAVHMTDAAHAGRFAKEAAVHLAYGDLPAARRGIEEAIRLDPHRDEHKMVLVTVLEGMGEHAKAREIIDEMLTRREELSGELRSQVEQLKKKSAG